MKKISAKNSYRKTSVNDKNMEGIYEIETVEKSKNILAKREKQQKRKRVREPSSTMNPVPKYALPIKRNNERRKLGLNMCR